MFYFSLLAHLLANSLYRYNRHLEGVRNYPKLCEELVRKDINLDLDKLQCSLEDKTEKHQTIWLLAVLSLKKGPPMDILRQQVKPPAGMPTEALTIPPLFQFLASASWVAADDSSSARASAIHMGDRDGISGSWQSCLLQTFRVIQQMEDSFDPPFTLSFF